MLCSHLLPIPETIRFGNHRAGITEINLKIIKFGSVIFLCVMVQTWGQTSQTQLETELQTNPLHSRALHRLTISKKLIINYGVNNQSSYPAETRKWNFSPFFSAKDVVKFGVKFSALRFPGFGFLTENFTKISRQKRCEKQKISRKFHSAGAQCW